MKKILLVCSAGMSTSILVEKMIKAAKENGEEVFIEAKANSNLEQYAGQYDCCLVGPQIRYAKDQVQKSLNEMPTEVIDMRVYGMGDGAKALEQAYALIK